MWLLIASHALVAGGAFLLARRLLSRPQRGSATPPANIPRDNRNVQLEPVLGFLARSMNATRAVLWHVDAEGLTAVALAASAGRLPDEVRLYGDPLRWTWSEGVPLRITEASVWSAGAS